MYLPLRLQLYLNLSSVTKRATHVVDNIPNQTTAYSCLCITASLQGLVNDVTEKDTISYSHTQLPLFKDQHGLPSVQAHLDDFNLCVQLNRAFLIKGLLKHSSYEVIR